MYTKGHIVSQETRKKQSEARKGKPSLMLGRHFSDEARKNMSKSRMGRKLPPFTELHKKKISEAVKGHTHNLGKHWKVKDTSRMGKVNGKNHGRWNGGTSFLPYSVDWTETLKKSIRERDRYICKICNVNGYPVHHIDYDKKNCNPENLITLCVVCHSKTNSNRFYWTNFFKKI